MDRGLGVLFLHMTARIAASFGKHISNIVALRTNEKVGRVTASRGVAFVTYIHALRNLSVRQYPRDAVGESALALVSCTAITIFGYFTLPFPASVGTWLINSLPKRLFSRLTDMVLIVKAAGMALDQARAIVIVLGNGSLIAATTLTLAVRVQQAMHRNPGRIFSSVCGLRFASEVFALDPSTMPTDETRGFAFLQTILDSCVGTYGRFLSATAVTVAVWDFVRGSVRGIVNHSRFSFQNLLAPRDTRNVAVAFSLV